MVLWLSVTGCHRTGTYHGIEIVGSNRFATQIRLALNIIRTKSPDDFLLISKHVTRIEECERSGMDIRRSTCQLAPRTAYYSLTWCAASIAHEAHHGKLGCCASYSYGHAHEERACIDYQRAILERIGAPAWEIEYLATLDGNHFDTDGDGKYTWKDYKRRNW